MSEKLHLNTENYKTPEIPDEVKDMDFRERFKVDPEEFPTFNLHSESTTPWNINKTLSKYLTSTAELIAEIDGTSTSYEDNSEQQKPDMVIYLDKSARPVSWLVNALWNNLSTEKRPESRYLAIDRVPWFRRANAPVDAGGYRIKNNPEDPNEKANASDFINSANNLPPDTYARIRSLFIPGGIEEENPDKIMQTSTGLEGKNILIVDEVKHSGATLGIAEFLIKKALPEISSVRGTYFWQEKGKNDEMLVTTWYNSAREEGRGVGDVDEGFWQERYEKMPNNRTRAQAYGALALGRLVNLDQEGKLHGVEKPSRELANEILNLRSQFESGRVAFFPPLNYSDDRKVSVLDAQNIELSPDINNPKSTIYLKNLLEK